MTDPTTSGRFARVMTGAVLVATAVFAPACAAANPAQSSTGPGPAWHLDFGGSVAVAPEYTAVTHTTHFTPKQRFGWTTDNDAAVKDRGVVDPLERDFVTGHEPAVFRVSGLAPGTYQLTIRSGDTSADPHATRIRLNDNDTPLPVLTAAAGEIAELKVMIRTKGNLDITIDSPQDAWLINSIELIPTSTQEKTTVSRQRIDVADEVESHTLLFDTTDPGLKRSIETWGIDTAWAVPDHMIRGLLYMGSDQIDVVRVSFPIDTPLVNGDLPKSKDEHFTTRLKIAKLAGNKPFAMLPDTEAGVNAWYKDGKEVNPERWVQLMAASQRRYGKRMSVVDPFNEGDWGWGQGSAENLAAIMKATRNSPAFASAKLGGPSTLNADAADYWYQRSKQYIDIATTHTLHGTLENYANFYLNAIADGKIAENPEVHNLAEVIAGAEYGVQGGIWWGTAERARGEFVKAVQGMRLAFAEDRPHWSAAAVYRAPSGKLQAFFGSNERTGQETTFRLVCRDRDVYFDGHGPQREYTVTVGQNHERVVDITWGPDVPPPTVGNYVIVNRANGKVIGVADSDRSNGAAVEQMDYTKATNQQFQIAPISVAGGDDSYFAIRALHSGKTLDMTDWSHDEGGPVQQWGEGDVAPQQWYFEYAGDNCFYIRSRWSTKCIQPSGDAAGTRLRQASFTGKPEQQWRLVPLPIDEIDFAAPKVPTGVRASAQAGSISLTWDANAETDVVGYNIYRATQSSGPYDMIARGVTETTFIDHQAKPSETYHYFIKAVDRSQNISDDSNETAASR